MPLFTKHIIESSIEIKTSPEKIWDFFYNLEKNYQKWYPEEHHFFMWIKGKPLEIGSKFDSLEIVEGYKTRLKGYCIESIVNKKITLKPTWPTSITCPKLEWIFEPHGDTTTFIAKTHFKFGKIFLALAKDSAKKMMEVTKRHMDQEGVNLKKILED